MAGMAVAGLHAAIDRGNIQGTVTDAQGAAIPGASVVVKNTSGPVVEYGSYRQLAWG